MKTVCTIPPRTIAGFLKIAASEDVRYYLNGLYCEPETGVFVATDGHVLMAHRSAARIAGLAPFVIPAKLLTSVAKSKCQAVRISIAEDGKPGERSITLEPGSKDGDDFTPDGATFTGNEVAGRYPDWQRVVPTRPSGEASQVNPEYLARELVRSLRESTPGEIAEAARMLDDVYTDMSVNSGERHIARLLAPIVHKLRK